MTEQTILDSPTAFDQRYTITERFGSGAAVHRLVCDDNLPVLDALVADGERFELVFVDPPYNTGRSRDAYRNAFSADGWQWDVSQRLARCAQLISETGSVVVTVDARSLGAMLGIISSVFPSPAWWHQIVTVVTNPSGSAMRGFRRNAEFYLFIHRQGAGPRPVVLGEHWGLTGGDLTAGTARRNRLVKSGLGHTPESSPGCFYPVFIDRATGGVLGCGEAVDPALMDQFEDPDPAVATCWPVRTDGSLGRWRVASTTASALIERGFITTGRLVKGAEHRTAIKYLTSGTVAKIDNGEMQVTGYDVKTGAAVVESAGAQPVLPRTVWVVASHNYSVYGSWLLRRLVPQVRFSHPKSLYAMEDLVRFCAPGTTDRVLDVYAGSGSMTHAVMLLNSTDGGTRSSVAVTRNETAEADHDPDDPQGIYTSVLVPRVLAALTGVDPSGKRISGNYEWPKRSEIGEGLGGVVEMVAAKTLIREHI